MKTSNRLRRREPVWRGALRMMAGGVAAGCLLLCGCSEDLSGPAKTGAALLPEMGGPSASNVSEIPLAAQQPMAGLVQPSINPAGSNSLSVAGSHATNRPLPPAALALLSNPGGMAVSNRLIGAWRRFVSAPGEMKVCFEGGTVTHAWHLEGDVIQGTLEAGPGFPTQPGQTALPGLVNGRANAFIPLRSLKQVQKDTATTALPPGLQDLPSSPAEGERLFRSDAGIHFSIRTLELKGLPRRGEDPFVFEAAGELVLAGVTNQVSLPLFITPLTPDHLRVQGETTFRMEGPQGAASAAPSGGEVKLSLDWTVQEREAVF